MPENSECHLMHCFRIGTSYSVGVKKYQVMLTKQGLGNSGDQWVKASLLLESLNKLI